MLRDDYNRTDDGRDDSATSSDPIAGNIVQLCTSANRQEQILVAKCKPNLDVDRRRTRPRMGKQLIQHEDLDFVAGLRVLPACTLTIASSGRSMDTARLRGDN